MLACARIGAAHSVIFGGFSPESIVDRVNDAQCVALITADFGWRRGSKVPLKRNCDIAMERTPSIEHCIVARRVGDEVFMHEGRDYWWDEVVAGPVDGVRARTDERRGSALPPLHERYDGQAKGHQAHHRRDILTHVAMTHKLVFDLKEEQRHLLVHRRHRLGYRPLVHRLRTAGQRRDRRHLRRHAGFPGQGSLLGDRRALRRDDSLHRADRDSYVHEVGRRSIPARHDLSSLRLLGTVGEPINPEAWMWYREWIGGKPHAGRRHVVADGDRRHHDLAVAGRDDAASRQRDATVAGHRGRRRQRSRRIGAARRRRLRRADAAVAGHAARHLGRRRALRADVLVAASRTSTSPATAAGAIADGNYWFMGRIDDVMNVSGHRISTTEVESALVDHPAVAEAAVCGKLDEMTGQAIYAFVSLKGSRRGLARVRRRAARSRRRKAWEVHPSEVRHVHAGASQDAQREDHAAPLARHRRGAHARRYDDAGRFVDRQGASGAREGRGQRKKISGAHPPAHGRRSLRNEGMAATPSTDEEFGDSVCGTRTLGVRRSLSAVRVAAILGRLQRARQRRRSAGLRQRRDRAALAIAARLFAGTRKPAQLPRRLRAQRSDLAAAADSRAACAGGAARRACRQSTTSYRLADPIERDRVRRALLALPDEQRRRSRWHTMGERRKPKSPPNSSSRSARSKAA